MVGEIRDTETAEIAIHASLTGHLVFSTLHTNDAASAIARLVEMGVQTFLIASSLLAVLAQRLVRQLCLKCREPFIPSDEDLRSLDLEPSSYGPPRPLIPGQNLGFEVDQAGAREHLAHRQLAHDDEPTQVAARPISAGEKSPRPVFYKPHGCEACAGTGYTGRIGIYELLVVDEAIRREVLNNSDAKQITRIAGTRGMTNLREDGVRQVLAGRTSIEEVLTATHGGELDME
jgi:general secretion pathway protein E